MNKKTIIGYQELRKARISESGAYYFVTSSTYKKQPILNSEHLIKEIISALIWHQTNNIIELICYVIMPDHIHILFRLLDKKNLSDTIKSIKQYSSTNIKLKLGLDHPVWQSGFYDRYIRNEKELTKLIEYCQNNPIKAGLVKENAEYPYFWCKGYRLNVEEASSIDQLMIKGVKAGCLSYNKIKSRLF
jgi:putative transposase